MARFSFILPVQHGLPNCPRWMDRRQHRRLCAVAAEVRARTGARTWIDIHRHEAMFGYIDPGQHARRLAFGVKLYRGDGSPSDFDPVLDGMGVDNIVWLLQVGKVDPALKAKWKRDLDARRAHAEYEARNRDWENNQALVVERDMERVYNAEKVGKWRLSRGRGNLGLRPREVGA